MLGERKGEFRAANKLLKIDTSALNFLRFLLENTGIFEARISKSAAIPSQVFRLTNEKKRGSHF
jgi:hypothetical protein